MADIKQLYPEGQEPGEHEGYTIGTEAEDRNEPPLTDEEIAEALANMSDDVPNGPPPTPTVGDDVASMAGLITQIAKDFHIKPDLAFKLLELTLNYKLAMRQLASAPPSFIPPYPTRPETEEITDGHEEG